MRTFFSVIFVLIFIPKAIHAQNLFQVTFPNDTVVVGCGTAIDTTYPLIVQLSTCNMNVGVSVTDQVFTTGSAGACNMIYRKFRVVEWCNHNPNTSIPFPIPNPTNTMQGPTVFGTVQNNGDLVYTQIIKRLDNDGPKFLNCPASPVTYCDYTTNDPNQWNQNHFDQCEGPVTLATAITDVCSGSNLSLSYKLFLDTDNNGSMETVVNSNSLGAWPIITQVSADTLRGRIDFSPNIQLPYGRHKIQWTTKDYCGNQSLCQYEFIVKDCAAPTVICLHGISVNLMPGGMITIPESQLLQYTYDNCTPVAQIKTGIRIAGTGTGFPLNQKEVNLTCQHLGLTFIEVWGQDQFGNADFCTARINVQDHIGACPPGNKSGTLLTSSGNPAIGVPLKFSFGTDTRNVVTDAFGRFDLVQVPACGGSLTPDLWACDQIDVSDILRLERHLLGLEIIHDPATLCAADLNTDHLTTSTDLQGLISSVLSGQTQSQTLQILPAQWQWNNPNMPNAAQLIPCNYTTPASLQAIAIGDVDGSWAQNGGAKISFADFAPVSIEEKTIEANTVIEIPVVSPDLDGLPALQFALKFNTSALQLLNVTPSLVSQDLISQSTNEVFAIWYDPYLQGASNKGMKVEAYRLRFQVLQSGKLSDYLWIDADRSKACQLDYEAIGIELQWQPESGKRSVQNALTLWPNPASAGNAICTIHADATEEMHLTLSDLRGTVHFDSKIEHPGGSHTINFSSLPSGRYLVRVVNNKEVLSAVWIVE